MEKCKFNGIHCNRTWMGSDGLCDCMGELPKECSKPEKKTHCKNDKGEQCPFYLMKNDSSECELHGESLEEEYTDVEQEDGRNFVVPIPSFCNTESKERQKRAFLENFGKSF